MDRRLHGALLGGLLVATAAAYLPCLDGPFLFDDEFFLKDPLLRAPFDHGLGAWFLASRPVTLLTFWLNVLAGGLDTRGWHLANLAIHLAAVALAFRLARRLFARAGLSAPEGPALAAAALFALHPLQSEAVAYLFQRAESLGSALWLLGLLLLLARDEAAAPRRRAALLAGAGLTLAVGLLVKPIAATLPVAWLLCAGLLPPAAEAERPLRRRVLDRLPAAAPLLALSALAAARELALASGTFHAGLGVPGLPPHLYLATELRVVPTYLRLALWPAGQCADWLFPPSTSLLEGPVLAGGALLLALAGGAVALAVRAGRQQRDGAAAARLAALGGLLFLLVLAPSSSVVPLADPLAEHRTYLAVLALALAAAAGGAWVLRRLAGRRAALAGAALLALLLPALGAATWARAGVWTSAGALWGDAARREPVKARVLVNLASAQFAEGRAEEALATYRRAVARLDDRSARLDEALLGVVDALTTLGRFDEARAEVEAALARAPASADTLALLALVEYRAARPAACAAAATRALALDPGQHFGLKYLGLVRSRQGDLAAARALLLASAAADPRDAVVFLGLGEVEARLGNRPAACAAYDRAAHQPGFEPLASRAEEAMRALGCGVR